MEKTDVIQNIVKWCSDFKEQDLMTHTEKRTDLWMVEEVKSDKTRLNGICQLLPGKSKVDTSESTD